MQLLWLFIFESVKACFLNTVDASPVAAIYSFWRMYAHNFCFFFLIPLLFYVPVWTGSTLHHKTSCCKLWLEIYFIGWKSTAALSNKRNNCRAEQSQSNLGGNAKCNMCATLRLVSSLYYKKKRTSIEFKII